MPPFAQAMSPQTVSIIALIAYNVVLLAIGWLAAKRVRGEADFFIGGHAVGPWVSGLSYAASTSSAWVLIGFTGFVYAAGVSALWMLPGIWAGYIFTWLVIGPRLQRAASEGRLVTPTDYLTQGMSGAARRMVAIASTLVILFCFSFYIAGQFDAAGKAFVSQFGFGATPSIIVGAVVIVAYALLGGFWAVSVTDTLQAVMMVAVAIALPAIALLMLGGPSGLVEDAAENTSSAYWSITGERGGAAFFAFAAGLTAVGLGTFGQPHLLARMMALKDQTALRRGFGIAMSWSVLVFLGMAVVGLSARALVGGELADAETAFYRVANQVLPAALAGIVIAAVLSAVMSTVDSVLLSASAAVAHDLDLTRREPKAALAASRGVMIAIAIVSVVLTLTVADSIFNRVLFAWSALGAAFGPLVFARVFGLTVPPAIVLAAIVSGFGATLIFHVLGAVAADGWIFELARAPGDLAERLLPWAFPTLLILAQQLARKPAVG